MPELLDVRPVPMVEAIEFFGDKVILTADEFAQLDAEAKSRAFAISGLAEIDAATRVAQALDGALREGTTYRDFAKQAGPILAGAGLTETTPFKLQTIFRNNVMQAYGAGSYRTLNLPAVRRRTAGWMYDAIGDSRTRPTHQALDGLVYAADDPFWQENYPPNGHNCRCGVVAVSPAEMERRGLELATEVPTVTTGAGVVQAGADRGWKFNAGQTAWGRGLVEDQVKAAWSVDDGMSGARRLGRVTSRSIEGLPAVSDGALSEQQRRQVLAAELGVSGDGVAVLEGADGRPVLAATDVLEGLDALDAHAAALDGVATLREADEVWLTRMRDEAGRLQLAKHYVRYLSGERSLVVHVARVQRTVWTGYQRFGGDLIEDAEQLRAGVLLQRRDEVQP